MAQSSNPVALSLNPLLLDHASLTLCLHYLEDGAFVIITTIIKPTLKLNATSPASEIISVVEYDDLLQHWVAHSSTAPTISSNPLALSVSQPPSLRPWILDPSASNHMIGNQFLFSCLSFSNVVPFVTLTNGSQRINVLDGQLEQDMNLEDCISFYRYSTALANILVMPIVYMSINMIFFIRRVVLTHPNAEQKMHQLKQLAISLFIITFFYDPKEMHYLQFRTMCCTLNKFHAMSLSKSLVAHALFITSL
ncbi:hypothetical protein CR513_32097, partial [Mucuna pruriens]